MHSFPIAFDCTTNRLPDPPTKEDFIEEASVVRLAANLPDPPSNIEYSHDAAEDRTATAENRIATIEDCPTSSDVNTVSSNQGETSERVSLGIIENIRLKFSRRNRTTNNNNAATSTAIVVFDNEAHGRKRGNNDRDAETIVEGLRVSDRTESKRYAVADDGKKLVATNVEDKTEYQFIDKKATDRKWTYHSKMEKKGEKEKKRKIPSNVNARSDPWRVDLSDAPSLPLPGPLPGQEDEFEDL